ncbi:MAG: hypothetical protein CVV45_12500 [Spirochaetae bacterium HGW-Spirochaetae-10]|jgi:hypothetical protein|nr:MAG: hypothetical protein CVV45_12500 [Spirochaetae bacterium HGW-Spirochaetae-10]
MPADAFRAISKLLKKSTDGLFQQPVRKLPEGLPYSPEKNNYLRFRMCIERVHRIMMASVISIGAYLLYTGSVIGLAILGFVVFMLLLWAFTNFCPSVFMLGRFLKPCWKE